MGRKKWKAGLCVIGAAMIGMLGYWIYDIRMRPEVIPPSEKVLLSDQILPGLLRIGPPSLTLWAYMTYFDDVFVVEGTVIEKTVQWGGVETVGTVDLKRVWYGELPESMETIPVWMLGDEDSGMSKPDVRDSVLIFLYKQQQPYTKEDTYWSLDMDHSVFDVVRGRVYAYSNAEDICRYDGKRISALMNDFRKEAETYEDIETPEQAYSIYGQSRNEENRN